MFSFKNGESEHKIGAFFPHDEEVGNLFSREAERKAAYAEAQERADFDKYFADNKKEWANPFIADGYFAKFKEAKAQESNKNKMLADILSDLTKDDTTAFKIPTPTVKLKGAEPMGGGEPTPKLTGNKFF